MSYAQSQQLVTIKVAVGESLVIKEFENMKILKTPAIEAGKEMGRVVLIAIIPLLILQLEAGRIEWKALAVVGAIAGLRAIDKYLHKAGTEKGLTRF